MQITQIQGGTAANVVPVPCWFGWDMRALPGFDPMTLERRLKAFAPRMPAGDAARGARGRHHDHGHQPRAGFAAETGSGIVPLTLKLAGQNETLAVSYCTEAGLFQDGGLPGRGLRPRRHRPGAHAQRVRRASTELEKCLAFLARLADWAEA